MLATFPHSFLYTPHPIVPDAHWWRLFDSAGKQLISVVGGGRQVDLPQGFSIFFLKGDGVDTFEAWFKDEEEPRDFLTADDINQLIIDKGIVDPPFESLEFTEIKPR